MRGEPRRTRAGKVTNARIGVFISSEQGFVCVGSVLSESNREPVGVLSRGLRRMKKVQRTVLWRDRE